MFLFGLILIIVLFVLHTVNLILIAAKNKKKFARADVPPMQMWFVNPGETGNDNLPKFVEDYTKSLIPEGIYCYDHVNRKYCPYFSIRDEEYKRELVEWQFCKLLNKDLSIQDAVKDCGINDEIDEDEFKVGE